MKLRTYLVDVDLSTREFAKKIRYSHAYLTSVMRGQHKPSIRFVEDVIRSTDGKVSAEEIVHITKKRKMAEVKE